MKLGIVIREAGFISPQIFINIYKTQCFQCVAEFEVSYKFMRISIYPWQIGAELMRYYLREIQHRKGQ